MAVEGIGNSESPDSSPASQNSNWEKDPSAWKIAIYPVYAWAPVMGAHINVPDFPSLPGAPARPVGPNSGTASGSFNGAGFAAFEISKSRWVGTGQFMLASISGDNSNPAVHLGLRVFYGQAMFGREVLPGLSLEGGVRRMALKVSASIADRPEVSRKPSLTDPLIGTTWHHQFGRKWQVQAHFDGGGFGVGSDVTFGASARADWRFAKHFGVAMGFGALHFRLADTVFDSTSAKRTLSVRQTLYGPLLGLGIYF